MNRVARQSATLSFLFSLDFYAKILWNRNRSVIMQKILGSYYYTINENLFNYGVQ